MKKIVWLSMMVISSSVFAKDVAFPPQCKDIGVQYVNNNALLVTKKNMPRLYAFANMSNQVIWINHDNPNGAGMGAGFASQLASGHWSALQVSQNNFSIDCHVQTATGMTPVSCQKVLHICEFQKMHTVKSGDYWAVENVPASQLMERLKIRGF